MRELEACGDWSGAEALRRDIETLRKRDQERRGEALRVQHARDGDWFRAKVLEEQRICRAAWQSQVDRTHERASAKRASLLAVHAEEEAAEVQRLEASWSRRTPKPSNELLAKEDLQRRHAARKEYVEAGRLQEEIDVLRARDTAAFWAAFDDDVVRPKVARLHARQAQEVHVLDDKATRAEAALVVRREAEEKVLAKRAAQLKCEMEELHAVERKRAAKPLVSIETGLGTDRRAAFERKLAAEYEPPSFAPAARSRPPSARPSPKAKSEPMARATTPPVKSDAQSTPRPRGRVVSSTPSPAASGRMRPMSASRPAAPVRPRRSRPTKVAVVARLPTTADGGMRPLADVMSPAASSPSSSPAAVRARPRPRSASRNRASPGTTGKPYAVEQALVDSRDGTRRKRVVKRVARRRRRRRASSAGSDSSTSDADAPFERWPSDGPVFVNRPVELADGSIRTERVAIRARPQ